MHSSDATERANKAVVRRYLEDGWNKADVSVVDECFSPGAVIIRRLGRSVFNNETVKQEMREWHAAFPDFRYTILSLLADGDRVVAHRAMTGTHQGVFLNAALALGPWPPTGKAIDVWDIGIYRLGGGKIVELTSVWQRADFLDQLTPPTPG